MLYFKRTGFYLLVRPTDQHMSTISHIISSFVAAHWPTYVTNKTYRKFITLDNYGIDRVNVAYIPTKKPREAFVCMLYRKDIKN
jgi:hypothetical protein